MFKRTIKLLALAALMVFIGGSATAQGITEFKTINGYIDEALYCPGTYYASGHKKVLIFNQQFENTNTINVPPESEDRFHFGCLSKNIFTNSGKYELIIAYCDAATHIFKVGIYNEDSELIYLIYEEFCDSYRGSLNKCYITNDKLVISMYTGKEYITKIYTLANSINSGISQVQQQNQSKLYPNPARQSVTLEYDIQGQMQEMQIMDINGRVVANYLLDPSQKQVNINTSDYKKGVYIYRYGNTSGKFVVE
ncbi:MAG: T9SS type A sorting domain-containing protein [Bacteroidales bacterium]|nr:T9SS type A sorting domain-containing protein [Bacteroidales bacterium]